MRTAPAQRIEEWLARLSLEEKIGQLLIPRPEREDPRPLIDRFAVGGFIVDRTNYDDPTQIAWYVNQLQTAARARGLLPLFITCDQEGGHNAFMKRGATEVPSNMGLAATHDPSAAGEAASILAAELRAVGVNWDLAPCVDVNRHPENPVIGVRAYSDDPDVVSAFGAAAVRAYQAAGLLACAKHFPGHGDTDLDSHVALPTVGHDRAELDRFDLPPFRAAIAAGVASVMTAHVMVPALDGDRVGTLSERMLTALLREQLGYEGIVITDAMDMAGVAEHWDDGEAAVETIRAGADVILTRRGLQRNERAFTALASAARSGRIPAERLESALRRLFAAKARLFEDGAVTSPTSVVGSPEHQRRALELARRSITVVRDEAGVLPLARDLGRRLLVLNPIGSWRTMMETWTARSCTLGPELLARIPGAVDLQIGFPLSASERESTLRAARGAEVIVAGTLNAIVDPDQVALLESLRKETSARIVVVALRTPYDLMRVPWVETYLCAYTTALPSMRAAAEVLTGERRADGRLPVELPNLHRRGHQAAA